MPFAATRPERRALCHRDWQTHAEVGPPVEIAYVGAAGFATNSV
jgi:hypothetical protein